MQNNRALWILVSILAAVFLLGGSMLLFWDADTPDAPAGDLSAETSYTDEIQTGTTTTASTTAETVTTTLTTVTTTETAETVTETTAPLRSPEEVLYAQYIDEMLVKRYGRSQAFTVGGNPVQTGIAAAFVRDFRDTGTPELLVIRLDKVLDSNAAAPVFMWYTIRNGEVTRLDEFECKMNWCEFAVRMSGNKLYISGDYGGIDFAPRAWLFSELAIIMQPDGDLILENMQQDYIEQRPDTLSPADSELLLEMQLADTDAAYPAARQYLLLEYSDLERLLADN